MGVGGDQRAHSRNRQTLIPIEGLRDGGDFNIMRDCLALTYRVKGYNSSAETTWSTMIGVHTESTGADATASFQIDSESVDPENPKYFGRAIFRDCTSLSNHSFPGTTAATKFTWVKDVYVDGCQFLHDEPQVTTFRLAGSVGRCRVKETFISREFHFQKDFLGANPPDGVRLESVEIGDGNHAPPESIEQARCNVFVASDCVLRNFDEQGILWWGADTTYTLITAINCDFLGNLISSPPAATADILPASGGQINRSRKALWLGNRRSNTGVGGQSRFTDPAVSSELFGTTRDASARVTENSAMPTGSVVNWALGDIVASTAPTSGGFYGWVCTSPGTPGVWKQWGVIA